MAFSEHWEIARRIAFTMATVAVKPGLPSGSSPEMLQEGAMERPEEVTPAEFNVAYLMRSTISNLTKGSPRRNLERRRGQTGYGARAAAVTQADIARNGLHEK
jgi:hypothetical protein